ncbi:MAG: DNA/RNA non-specific endonuclease [Bacteroidetes bacterium]|nr:MAG: DNA/RNA non-specific endonuclease [Bacteroidota bacterium]
MTFFTCISFLGDIVNPNPGGLCPPKALACTQMAPLACHWLQILNVPPVPLGILLHLRQMMSKQIGGRIIALALSFVCGICTAQNIERNLEDIEAKIAALERNREALQQQREDVKLQLVQNALDKVGLPNLKQGDALVWHRAMALGYAEAYEQARWVAHVILPDVVGGAVSRTNNFRPDTVVSTGSAVEADYFLKHRTADGSYQYDGFGYDRGHLAPSADFRWSAKALSESYLYSNMSPQLDGFNRGIWADLEDKIRAYVYLHPGSTLYVVTGPLLDPQLPKIERGVNKVAIPKLFWKVVLDLEAKKSLGFVIPNAESSMPLETYSVSVDSVEQLTGLNFFSNLETGLAAQIECQRVNADWFAEVASGDVEPVPIFELKRGQINTIIARNSVGMTTEVEVVGKVVGGRVSRAGNVLLNIDKQYPNELLSVFIKKEDIPNFGYDILPALKGKRVAIWGKVAELGGKPIMYVSKQKAIEILE